MENQDYRAQVADYVSACAFERQNLPPKEENVRVYTVQSPHFFSKPLLELSQALLRELAEVTEVDTAGSVQDLSVLNHSDLHLLIYEGTLLKGAKQNRIVNATVLLPPKAKTVIPASCVEAGRWSYSSRSFSKSPYDAPSSLRKRVRSSIYSSQNLKGDQSAVWDEVRLYSIRSSSFSPTNDFEEIYAQSARPQQVFPEGLDLPPTKGIFVQGKGECSLDYVANEEAFAGVLPRLVSGYEFSGPDADPAGQPDIKETILQSIREGEVFTQPSVGTGTDIWIRSPRHHISALLADGEIVSLSVTSA